jgi:transcriptional regulator with XRE-family HTH domain
MRPSRNALLLEALGLVLKDRRLELGLTQEDVAGAAEIDRPFVTLIEVARKQPSVSVFWKLAGALEISPGELASLVDQRYSMILKRSS